MSVNKLKKKLLVKKKKSVIREADLLSTGSTLLNLACSGNPRGGIPKGKYIYLVGDTSSGKTALSLTCLAEATINEEFEDYDLIHDDVEGGNMFNIKKLFGKKLYDRVKKLPGGEASQFLEEMYYNVDDAIKSGKPFIYIVDSMDGLVPKDDREKFEEKKKSHKAGKDSSGSYGTAKAKINSQQMGGLMTPLRKSKSILIVISQTRDNLGFSFNPKTRAGGRALPFYASLEMWSSVKGKIKKTVKGKSYVIGVIAKVQIKKNRITGKDRSVEIPIYYDTGFDDVGSCVDYLIEHKHWKKHGTKFEALELKMRGTRDAIIRTIEEAPINYRKMQNAVAKVWNQIETALEVKRRSRYA